MKQWRNGMEIVKLLSRRAWVARSGVQHLCTALPQENVNKLANFKEIKVPVPWGHIAAKDFGPVDGVPVLGVHGWQDNAGTFDGLAPLFPSNVRLVSVDLSGHGMSSHRPPGCIYSMHELVSDMLRVMDFLQWDKTSILAHSLGAFITVYFTWLFPSRVEKVIALDGFCPDRFPHQFRKQQVIEYFSKEKLMESWRREDAQSYEPEEACQRLIAMSGGYLSDSAASTLLIRGAFPCGLGNRLKFSRDPRIRYSYPMVSCIDYEMLDEAALAYDKKLLLFFGNDSNDSSWQFVRDPTGVYRKAFSKNCSYFKCVTIEGNHYAHLNNPHQYETHIVDFMNVES